MVISTYSHTNQKIIFTSMVTCENNEVTQNKHKNEVMFSRVTPLKTLYNQKYQES